MSGFDNFDSTLYPSAEKTRRAESLRSEFGLAIDVFNPVSSSFDVLRLEKYDVVINEMAIPGLSPSWSKFEQYVSSNLVSLQLLLDELVKRNPSVRLVHASTSSVYGNVDGNPTLDPISPYGVSKLAAENLLHSYSSEFEIEVAILRYFSVFGGVQRPDMAYSRFIRQILRGQEIEIYGDGSQSRTNTHVQDVASATLLAAELLGEEFTVDISGTEQVTLMEAIQIIEETVGKKASMTKADRRRGDQSISRGDVKRANEILGWTPKIGFRDGIADQVRQTRMLDGL